MTDQITLVYFGQVLKSDKLERLAEFILKISGIYLQPGKGSLTFGALR